MKGAIKEYPGMTLVCGGAYWDWPWWKRTLATLVRPIYSAYYRERARFSWKYVSHQTRDFMGRDGYLDTCAGMAQTRIKPIWWECKFD